MPRRKSNIESKEKLVTKVFDPVINYLISIENNPVQNGYGYFTYTMGIPKNWFINTEYIEDVILKENDTLKLVKITPVDLDMGVDLFYEHLIDVIEKNLTLDKKRIEMEQEIEKLKTKFTEEQNRLINNFYNTEEVIENEE